MKIEISRVRVEFLVFREKMKITSWREIIFLFFYFFFFIVTLVNEIQ